VVGLRKPAVLAVLAVVGVLGVLAGLTAIGGWPHGSKPGSEPGAMVGAVAMPTYDHVVVVVLENKSRTQIIHDDGYIRRLGDQGAEMTRSYAVTHPSQPNYIAMFAGSTHGVKNDSCPQRIAGGNLAQQLTRHGFTFKAYSEGLPRVGALTCSSPDGMYRRKHAPWVDLSTFDQRKHKPFRRFPDDYDRLPTVSFVIPNMCHDMHDCSIAGGNRWMRRQLDGYAQWAKTHNSLLVVTFDEDDDTAVNRIYTALIGARVKPGDYDQVINHYSVLRTLEDMYDLPALGNAATADPVRGIWG
jgi:hypothetical protein